MGASLLISATAHKASEVPVALAAHGLGESLNPEMER